MFLKIYSVYYAIVFSAISILASGQDKNNYVPNRKTIQRLNIGDKVPDIVFENMLFFPKKSVRLSEFKDKVVILDFWFTYCTSCINGFPNIDSLQKKYRDKLQVLLVNSKGTGDNESTIRAFFTKFTINGKPKFDLPSNFNDTLANKYFKHYSFPFYVWIRNQRVIAFTTSEEVIGENIEAVYHGRPVAFRMKVDKVDYEKQMPLFVNGNGGGGNNILFRSILTGYAPGLSIGSSKIINKDNLITKFSLTNMSLLNILERVYNVSILPSRIYFDVKEPGRLTLIDKTNADDWKYKNSYCYELNTPGLSLEKTLLKAKNELYNYFGYTAALEKRMIKCFVLKHTTQDTLVVNRSRKPYADVSPRYERNKLYNQSVAYLCAILEEFMKVPVFDETNYKQPIDIEFTIDIKNARAVQEALKPYGLELIETEREIEMFVISDKK